MIVHLFDYILWNFRGIHLKYTLYHLFINVINFWIIFIELSQLIMTISKKHILCNFFYYETTPKHNIYISGSQRKIAHYHIFIHDTNTSNSYNCNLQLAINNNCSAIIPIDGYIEPVVYYCCWTQNKIISITLDNRTK